MVRQLVSALGSVILIALFGASSDRDLERTAGLVHPPNQKTTPDDAVVITIAKRDEGTGARILQEVLSNDGGAAWSWTNAHPRFEFRLDEPERWELRVRLCVVGEVIKKAGPQQIRFVVNGDLVAVRRVIEPKEYLFRFPLARLDPFDPAFVEVGVDPTYIASDGVRLGVLLHSVGLYWMGQ